MVNLINNKKKLKGIIFKISSKDNSQSVNPGVFIDIDGVVLQGGKPFEFSKEAIHVKFLIFKW